MKDKEKALCKKNGVNDIVEIVVGNDGITLAYSRDAKPVNFTKEQLWKALSKNVAVDGKVVANPYKKWSDIDSSLPNQAIKVMIPPGTSGTRDAWNSLVMKKGIDKASKDLKIEYDEYREDGAVIEVGENDSLIIQKLTADKEMFGFFGCLPSGEKLGAVSMDGADVRRRACPERNDMTNTSVFPPCSCEYTICVPSGEKRGAKLVVPTAFCSSLRRLLRRSI